MPMQQIFLGSGGASGDSYWILDIEPDSMVEYVAVMDVGVDSDGNVYVGSTGNNIDGSGYKGGLVTKIDKEGTVLWQKTQHNSDNPELQCLGVSDDGSLIVYGAQYAEGPLNLGLNTSGVKQFAKHSGTHASDKFFGLAFFPGTTDYLVEGKDDSEEAWFWQKCNSSGTRQWITGYKCYPPTGTWYIQSLSKAKPFIDSSGNIYSIIVSRDSSFMNCVVKLNSSGVVQEDFEYNAGTSEDNFINCVVDSSDNIYIAARHRENASSGEVRASIIKTDSSGDILWQREMYDASESIYPMQVILDAAENPIMRLEDRTTDSNGEKAVGLVKWNSSGTLQWNRRLSAPTHESLSNQGKLIATPNDNILMTWTVVDGGDRRQVIAQLPADGTGTGTYGIFKYGAGTCTVDSYSGWVKQSGTHSTDTPALGTPTTSATMTETSYPGDSNFNSIE